MVIKVGQWVRMGKNNFVYVTPDMWIVGKYSSKIKVANTPVELVEVGDLVEVLYQHNNKVIPLALVTDYNDEFVFTLNAVVRKERIVSIYTPNADKTQYTEQYRVGN